MSFRVQLSTDHLMVEPGNAQPLSLTIEHEGEEVEAYELSVHGLDPSWYAIPMPSVEIEPQGTRTERMLFRMPRETDSRAGIYSFVVQVRSLATGEAKECPAILEIKPYHNINVDVNPKKVSVTPTNQRGVFEVCVMNLGNQEANVQIYATDVDDQCVFEFDQDRVILAPGQQQTVTMTARPGRTRWITGARLHGFSVTARSTELAGLMASSQAQLEERAMLTPATTVGAVALLGLVGAWILAFPKPPVIQDFVVEKEIEAGASVRVDWRTEHAKSIDILLNDRVVKTSLDERGFFFIPIDTAGSYKVVARAIDGKQVAQREQTVTVRPKKELEKPEIIDFSVEPSRVPVGGTVTIRYNFGPTVVRASLAPLGQPLDPKVHSIQVTPQQEGDIEYMVVAESKDGVSDSKKATVHVYKVSLAKLLSFKADHEKIQLGESVIVEWQATNAVRAELSADAETKTVSPTSGTMVVSPTKTTTYKLVLTDSQGETVTKSIRVVVEVPKPPQPTPPTPKPPDDPNATPANSSANP